MTDQNDRDVEIADEAREFAEYELQNYLDGYSPWIIVDKLKAKELDESDFEWMQISIQKGYIAASEGAENEINLLRQQLAICKEAIKETKKELNDCPDWLMPMVTKLELALAKISELEK